MISPKSPGVYVEEFESGSRPIEGASTSIGGFIGVAESGPTEGLPVYITSFADYQRTFGGYLPSSYGQYRYLPYAVESFFNNGGSKCYVIRVLPQMAKAAQNVGVSSGVRLQLTEDLEIGNTTLKLESLFGIENGGKLTIEVLDGKDRVKNSAEDQEIEYDQDNQRLKLKKPLSFRCGKDETRITVTKTAADETIGGGATLGISAINKGQWGNGIVARFTPSSQAKSQIIEVIDDGEAEKYRIKNKNGFYVGAIVAFIDNALNKEYRRIVFMEDDVITLSKALSYDGDVVDTGIIPQKMLYTCEFNLEVTYKKQVENYYYLSMNPQTPNYYVNAVNGRSNLIQLLPVSGSESYTREDPFDMPTNSVMINKNLCVTLADGDDGNVNGLTADDFKGYDNGPGRRTGIQAFKDIDNCSIMAMPGITDIDAQLQLKQHCESQKYRFAVLDIPETYYKTEDLKKHREFFDTSYAALYHPWVKTFDPYEKREMYMPPSGCVMGIYSRSDETRGVHKAPANEVVQNVTGLKYMFNEGEQDDLNPRGINLIRAFTGRGIRVWGARTCSSDSLWKYVNVRRLFIYLEESIYRNTQWVVFEPNNERLWARVKLTITDFLTRVWRDGAFMGTKPEQAFYVKCDRTTMTQDDIDNGRLIVEIGVAPVKPAEFVIFRITQWNSQE